MSPIIGFMTNRERSLAVMPRIRILNGVMVLNHAHSTTHYRP